jgi:hypothetical protein
MSEHNHPGYHIRTVEHSDIDQLLELEKEWPEHARASKELLLFRINQFQQGYFIAEDETGIIASIICYPYQYAPNDISNFKNWETVVTLCYQYDPNEIASNALYIVSGTSKPTYHGGEVFDDGVTQVIELAKKLGKHYVVGGCLLPGYARYISKHEMLSAEEYVFKKVQNRYVDPLIEKYRRLDFHVPDQNHVISNYYPHEPSLNYSALVVRVLEPEILNRPLG